MTPADPTPAPPPEWALDAAHEYFRDQWGPLGIPTGVAVNVAPLARLLASVREGAIRQAADTVCAMPVPVAFVQHGIMGVARMAAADAILSLIDGPPKEAP